MELFLLHCTHLLHTIYPSTEIFLYTYNRINCYLFLPNFCDILPKLKHILLLRRILIKFPPIIEYLCNIGHLIKRFDIIHPNINRLIPFLLHHHIIIHSQHRSMISQIMSPIKLISIPPISNPDNPPPQR
jgi:hypothetical protein